MRCKVGKTKVVSTISAASTQHIIVLLILNLFVLSYAMIVMLMQVAGMMIMSFYVFRKYFFMKIRFIIYQQRSQVAHWLLFQETIDQILVMISFLPFITYCSPSRPNRLDSALATHRIRLAWAYLAAVYRCHFQKQINKKHL